MIDRARALPLTAATVLVLVLACNAGVAAGPHAGAAVGVRIHQAASTQGGISVTRINIIGDTDDRAPIDTHGPELGLSASEIDRIKHSTGYVYCPGGRFGNRGMASAALIGSRSLIVTTAHTFIDEQGRRREPLASCYFLPDVMPWERYYLDFGQPYKIGTEHPGMSADDNGRDYAIVHLKSAVSDAEPLSFSHEPASEGQTIIGVSAFQEGIAHVDKTQPIVQRCTIKTVFADERTRTTSYYNDCDMAKGASGGVNLIKIDGALTIEGIFQGSGTAEHDHEPYNPNAGSFGFSAGIDGALADTITALAAGRAPPPEPQQEVGAPPSETPSQNFFRRLKATMEKH